MQLLHKHNHICKSCKHIQHLHHHLTHLHTMLLSRSAASCMLKEKNTNDEQWIELTKNLSSIRTSRKRNEVDERKSITDPTPANAAEKQHTISAEDHKICCHSNFEFTVVQWKRQRHKAETTCGDGFSCWHFLASPTVRKQWVHQMNLVCAEGFNVLGLALSCSRTLMMNVLLQQHIIHKIWGWKKRMQHLKCKYCMPWREMCW